MRGIEEKRSFMLVKDKGFYKTIFLVSLPAALQSLISFLVVIADNVMVSFVEDGVNAQAAVSQVNSITTFYTATILGVVGGSAVLISQYWGKNDIIQIKKIFSVVMRFSLGVALVFVALGIICPRAIVSLMVGKDSTAVTEYAVTYFRIVCFSWLPYAICYTLVGMLRCVEVVKVALYTSVVALVVDVGLNYILSFGKLGFPAMGVAGIAVGTLVSRIVELIIVLVFTFCIQKKIPVKLKDFFKTEKVLVKDYVRYGVPVLLTDMQWALVGLLKVAIIGHVSAVFMAANSIANSMIDLSTLFAFSLANGACVVVGKAVGRGDYTLARQYSNTIQLMFLAIGILMCAAVLIFNRAFVSLYGTADDPEVRQMSITFINIVAISLIGTSYHASCFKGINRGSGDSRFIALVDMICGWGVVIPLMLLTTFVFHSPLPVIFFCTRIDQCFKWIFALVRLRGNKWIKNVTRKTGTEGLPDTTG